MKIVKLTQGKVALVDDADFEWLNSVRWHAKRCRNNWYARCYILDGPGKYRRVGMHQLLAAVMGISSPDHADNNGLNNQRENLRPATKSQNAHNSQRYQNNTSGFIGVNWCERAGEWESRITKNKKRYRLGYFSTAEAAARARDCKAILLFGDRAKLNFPDETSKIQQQNA